MNQIVVTGMVLSAAPIGEYDKRVVILTKEHGKLSAFAKGARKPNSPLIGAVNPFSFGEFTMYEGRSSYTIQSVNITNYFAELRSDVEGAYYGFYFLEMANYYTREFNDEMQVLKLLYQTMRALVKKNIPNRLIRVVYELKIICINGEGPQVFQCVTCGNKENIILFSPIKGGLVCAGCTGDVIDGIQADTSTIYSLQYIESSKIERLYTFKVSDEVLDQLERIMKKYINVYIDKKFHSLEMLDILTEH